jgi:hypothetical protein
MPSFDAGTIVEPLEYDFTRYVPNCKGTVPEPSDDDIRIFFKGMKGLALEINEELGSKTEETGGTVPEGLTGDNPDVSKLVQFLETFDDETVVNYTNRMAELIGELCHQQPAAEDILRLPYRVRNVFIGWVVGNMTNPETAAAGTKP